MDACGRESITRQHGKPFHLEPRDPSFVSYINQRASYAVPSSIQVLRTCPERYSAVRPVHTSEANVRMRACVSGHMSMVEIWLVHLGHSWTWINGSQNRQGDQGKPTATCAGPQRHWATGPHSGRGRLLRTSSSPHAVIFASYSTATGAEQFRIVSCCDLFCLHFFLLGRVWLRSSYWAPGFCAAIVTFLSFGVAGGRFSGVYVEDTL
ncbi:hypothetical protein V8C43DRAFT_28406 [Trichoderma afarasin]